MRLFLISIFEKATFILLLILLSFLPCLTQLAFAYVINIDVISAFMMVTKIKQEKYLRINTAFH